MENLLNNGYNVIGAEVKLISEEGEIWYYNENYNEPGVYTLLDPDFKAIAGVKYKLYINKHGIEFESDWEFFPEKEYPSMGAVSFKEAERYKSEFRRIDEDPVVVSVKRYKINCRYSGEKLE